jgi:two-component system response regulator NreC
LSVTDAPVIHVALVDEQTMFREGLRALIEPEPDLAVVAQAPSIVELALDAVPDVIITDLPGADAAREEVVVRLRERFAGAAVLVLTTCNELSTVQRVLAAGADGYLLKSAAKSDLFAGIRTVAHGGLYLQPSIGVEFASRKPEDVVQPEVAGLTPKETDVLRLLALGHTNAEIAPVIGASLRTVETHRAHIHQKLDRHSRAQLVRFALDAGLLRLDDQGAPAPDRRLGDHEPDVLRG